MQTYYSFKHLYLYIIASTLKILGKPPNKRLGRVLRRYSIVVVILVVHLELEAFDGAFT